MRLNDNDAVTLCYGSLNCNSQGNKRMQTDYQEQRLFGLVVLNILFVTWLCLQKDDNPVLFILSFTSSPPCVCAQAFQDLSETAQ